MFFVNMTFISSREVKKCIFHSCLRHSSALMKYTFFHFTQWNKSYSLQTFAYPLFRKPLRWMIVVCYDNSRHQTFPDKVQNVGKWRHLYKVCKIVRLWIFKKAVAIRMALYDWLIVLEFNDTSTLVGHFVSSPRDREKRDRRDSRRDEREDREERGTGVKVKKQKK